MELNFFHLDTFNYWLQVLYEKVKVIEWNAVIVSSSMLKKFRSGLLRIFKNPLTNPFIAKKWKKVKTEQLGFYLVKITWSQRNLFKYATYCKRSGRFGIFRRRLEHDRIRMMKFEPDRLEVVALKLLKVRGLAHLVHVDHDPTSTRHKLPKNKYVQCFRLFVKKIN